MFEAATCTIKALKTAESSQITTRSGVG